MTIKPLSDKVVVKKLQAEEKTSSGIITFLMDLSLCLYYHIYRYM